MKFRDLLLPVITVWSLICYYVAYRLNGYAIAQRILDGDRENTKWGCINVMAFIFAPISVPLIVGTAILESIWSRVVNRACEDLTPPPKPKGHKYPYEKELVRVDKEKSR